MFWIRSEAAGEKVRTCAGTMPATRVVLAPPFHMDEGAETYRVMVNDELCEPEVPLTTMLYWPTAAVLDAVNVSVLEVDAGLGEKDAVMPVGRPETAS
jgi:hypothetical protein